MSRLHLMQASMEFSDTKAEIQSDFRTIFGRGAHMIGFTETAKDKVEQLLVSTATEAGYKVFHRGRDTMIATRKDLPFVDAGYVKVHDGVAGEFPERGVTWVGSSFQGDLVYFHEAHWVTKARLLAARQQLHMAMTDAVIETVDFHANGKVLSFFGGDTNIDEETDMGRVEWMPDHQFEQAGLLTCWDESGLIRNTMNNVTFDVLGRTVKDRRVELDHIKVWPQLNSNHKQVSAFYNIESM